jgi:hypothetical protein
MLRLWRVSDGFGARRMKGICKPKSIGVYVASEGRITISVGAHDNQRWNFEECGNGRICLYYKSIGIFMPHRQFDEDWEIIKTAVKP